MGVFPFAFCGSIRGILRVTVGYSPGKFWTPLNRYTKKMAEYSREVIDPPHTLAGTSLV
jgi:hypothetical protein